LSYLELNTLTFLQFFEAITEDSAEVNKDIWTVILLDETKAFIGVEPLYSARSCRHNLTFLEQDTLTGVSQIALADAKQEIQGLLMTA